MSISELINKSLPCGEWVHLAKVIEKFKDIDPDFSTSKYGFKKLLPLLQSVPELVDLEKYNSICPTYKCKLKTTSKIQEFSGSISQKNATYESLYSKYKEQPVKDIFAHFGWSSKNNETWETPFEYLANMAKPENWDFQDQAFKNGNTNFPILLNYLNYTFKRIQQQDKIVFSNDDNKACFNTGLQTPTEKDIYATFYRNKKVSQYDRPDWTLYNFADSYSKKVQDFSSLPEVATYIENSSDLVFDLSYELEINTEHIVKERDYRLPDILKGNKNIAMASIEGSKSFLKEKIRRNYKIAIPHWYNDKIQLLLPLNLTSDDKADLALVADKDSRQRKIYRIKTVLTMDMAYINARLICRPDREWLNP